MRTYIFHLKTLASIPQLPPHSSYTPLPSFKATFLKRFKFLLSHLLPNLLQFWPILIMPSRGFTRVAKVLEPRSGTCISVFTSCGPLWTDRSFFFRRYSFSLVSVISPSPDLPPLLPSFHCLFSLCLFSSAQMQAKLNLSSNLVVYQTEMLSRFRHHSVPQLSQP